MNPRPNEIKQARLDADLTQEQAASSIGYSRRSWQEWEYGTRNMRLIVFQEFLRRVKLV